MKMTPVLLVHSIEKSLPFWSDRLGWQKIVEVPEGDTLGFVILMRENVELMLQTYESVRNDAPEMLVDGATDRTSLFIEVNDWSDILDRLHDYKIAMPERRTFYGMREIGVHDPDGNSVVFALRIASPAENQIKLAPIIVTFSFRKHS